MGDRGPYFRGGGRPDWTGENPDADCSPLLRLHGAVSFFERLDRLRNLSFRHRLRRGRGFRAGGGVGGGQPAGPRAQRRAGHLAGTLRGGKYHSRIDQHSPWASGRELVQSRGGLEIHVCGWRASGFSLRLFADAAQRAGEVGEGAGSRPADGRAVWILRFSVRRGAVAQAGTSGDVALCGRCDRFVGHRLFYSGTGGGRDRAFVESPGTGSEKYRSPKNNLDRLEHDRAEPWRIRGHARVYKSRAAVWTQTGVCSCLHLRFPGDVWLFPILQQHARYLDERGHGFFPTRFVRWVRHLFAGAFSHSATEHRDELLL